MNFEERVDKYLATFLGKNPVVEVPYALTVALDLSREDGEGLWEQMVDNSKGLQRLFTTIQDKPSAFLKNVLAMVFVCTKGSLRHNALARLLFCFGGDIRWAEDLYELERRQSNPLDISAGESEE